MESDFTVECPFCGEINDYTDENWIGTATQSDKPTYEVCQFCNEIMVVEVITLYQLNAKKKEWE